MKLLFLLTLLPILISSDFVGNKYCGKTSVIVKVYGSMIFCEDKKTFDVGVIALGLKYLYCDGINYTFDKTNGEFSLSKDTQPDCYKTLTDEIQIDSIKYDSSTNKVVFLGNVLGTSVKLDLVDSLTNCADSYWKGEKCSTPGGNCPTAPWIGCLSN